MAITRFPLETDQPVVEVTLPPGRHVLELVVEDSAGLRSEPDTVTITIENVLPVISGIEPAGARQGAESVTATISGLNLEKVQAVSFADGGITVEDFTENSPAELQVVLSVDPDATPGPRRFTVTTEAGSVDNPAGVTFSVDEGLPVITAINPDTGQPGDSGLRLTISGRYLQDVEDVTFLEGGIRVSDFTERNPESLEVLVSIDPDATDGPRRFRVTTDEGTTESPAGVRFTVATAAPVIVDIQPDSGPQGALNREVIILGSNLFDVSSVSFAPVTGGINFITVSDIGAQTGKKLIVFLNIHKTAKVGPYNFTVNTDHGSAQSPPEVVFTVTGVDQPTVRPTIRPTIGPTVRPTLRPTFGPTIRPTILPTVRPTLRPTVGPTIRPTILPTVRPTLRPTFGPTIRPTISPTVGPTLRPPIIGPTFGPIIFSARDFPGRNVQEVKGIGPATAERLKKKRITNLAHLASTEPGKLAEILDISEVRAMAFIDEARRLLTIEE
jgi:hypothetical protein